MNTSFSCFIRVIKCGLTVIISSLYIKNDLYHPIPHTKELTENQRLPFVWLKCSVKVFKSRLRVNGNEKMELDNDSFSRVSRYPAQP